ncbi:MAG TPA: ABC transporter substrate-binding protein [Alphaproteobacteria bacterium]
MRIIMSLLAGVLALAAAGPAAAQQKTQIKFLLDWKYQAVHSWYFVAQQKGYFAREGLDVVLDQGAGGAGTTQAIVSNQYPMGVGDINILIQATATRTNTPLVVYMLYNNPPFALIAKADGPVKTLKDLEGRSLAAAAGGSAIKLFPILARMNGVDPTKVNNITVSPQLQEQVVVNGTADASAVFNQTSYINLIGMKLDPDTYLRWFSYKDYGIDLYSNCIIVSAPFAKENPKTVAAFLRAVNAGLRDVIKDRDGGIKALVTAEPLTNAPLERKRLDYVFDNLMLAPETEKLGLGDVDDQRMAKGIAMLAEAFELPRKPAPGEVFDRSFLPARAERTY